MISRFDMITTPHQLIRHIIHGDIDEMPYSILGDLDVSHDHMLDEEEARLRCAATVAAYFDGKLNDDGTLKE